MRRQAASLVLLGLATSLSACAGPASGPDATDASPAVAASGVVTPTTDAGRPEAGGAEASCVESYSPEAVAGRAFAFDGVVTDLGRSVTDRDGEADLGFPGVTFEVREWFAGGEGDTVTVDLQGTGAEPTEGDAAMYDIGSRLLVSGEPRWGGAPLDAPIAWACGFTRAHDAATAADWRAATRP
ncbi:hypothetical protein G5V58_09425 [Nocardioides anomalus]|uniref:Uncharacterized protein n=1 Tax=Nocardioides anomalus TaxID=2712223 RepID=A0A6G6WCI1_9ACTN|nr:hypothetical protein [Nocardioides anomalus]QIG42952.1 hypothetical protein G5V58_09425 [Nocardioides anomalus]